MAQVESVNVEGYQLSKKYTTQEVSSPSSSGSGSPRDQQGNRVVETIGNVPGGLIRTTDNSYREEGKGGRTRKTEMAYGGTNQLGQEVAGYVASASSSHFMQGPTTTKTYGAQQVSTFTGPAVTKTSTTTKDFVSGATSYTQSGSGTYTQSGGFVASAPASHRVVTEVSGSASPYNTSQVINSARQTGGMLYDTSRAHLVESAISCSPSQMATQISGYQTTSGVFPTSSTTTTTNQKYIGGASSQLRHVSATGMYNKERVNAASFKRSGTLTEGKRIYEGSQTAYVSGTAYSEQIGEARHMTHTYTGQERIISEKIIEVERMVPKKIVVEEIVEKIVVVPEKRVREEVREEMAIVRERIIEVAKPIYQEKIVEVPEIEYVEKLVEYAEVVVQEKIREVPVVEYLERIIEVPTIVYQDKIVEIQEIECREVAVERIEEVVEIREQVVVKEIPVPQYVDKPFPEYVDVEEAVEVVRHLPIPIEAIATYEFKLPQIRAKWKSIEVPLYVPRFVELPVPIEFMEHDAFRLAESYAQKISMLGMMSSTSLCELENLAKIKETNFDIAFRSQTHSALLQNYSEFLSSGTVKIEGQCQAMETQVQQQFNKTKIQSTVYGNEISGRGMVTSHGMTAHGASHGMTAHGASHRMTAHGASHGMTSHGASHRMTAHGASLGTTKYHGTAHGMSSQGRKTYTGTRQVGDMQYSRLTSAQAQAANLMQKIVEEQTHKGKIRADSRRVEQIKHATTVRSKHRDHKERNVKKSSKTKPKN